MLHSSFILSCLLGATSAALTDSNLEKHVGTLSLSASFNPIKESYWTGYPHHRRTPFAVSPDGKSAYLAYLDASETDVHVQQVDPSTFAAVGTATTVSGAKEAGGLVAHNDGFALLTNEALPSGTSDAPADSTPVPVLYRYTGGEQTFKTFLGGPGVHDDFGLAASPDLNGDLAFSEATGIYGAYFVVTDYTGDASGHFGDSIQYVSENGTLETITGASSSWGCSHNTGIAFEAADSVPFASICAEDQGAIWLNTETQSMNGVKISNENTTNGGGGEAMGGMSGSYSGLARFIGSDSYIFAWVSRGAKDLTENTWLGSGFTNAQNRTNNRNVAIAQFTDKNTLVGDQASSEVGAADGDSQVNWITTGTADCSNAHVAAFDGENALVTWEEIAEPQCDFIAMGCKGAYTGSYFQLVNNGAKVGDAVKATDVFVAGDMVTMSDGRICWPYVDMDWTLDGPVANPASVTKMSFACMGMDGNSTSTPASSAAAGASSTVAASSKAAVSSAPLSTSVVQEVVSVSSAAPSSEATAVEPTSAPVASPMPSTSVVAEIPSSVALPSLQLVSSSALVSSAAVSTPASSAVPTAPAFSEPFSVSIPTELPAPTRAPAESHTGGPRHSGLPSFSMPSGFPNFPSPTFGRGPSGVAWPTGFPGFGNGAWPTGFGHHGHHHHRPSGFGRFGGPFPTGMFGATGAAAQSGFGKTPCGFETRVRPTGVPTAVPF